MRLILPALLTLAAGLAFAPGLPASAQPHRASRHHAPARCPELRIDGFCPYDSGWRPAADNPLFSPLRPGDPQVRIGPACDASDSHGRVLISYDTENPEPAMRIGARLVRFRPAASDSVDRYVAPEGRLTIREGREVSRAHESDGARATLIFVDRQGRAHTASVRLDCWV